MIYYFAVNPELWGALALIVAAIIGAIATIISTSRKDKNQTINNSQSQPVHYFSGTEKKAQYTNSMNGISSNVKSTIHILFIDDEKFENVNILKNAGWLNTKTIKDIKRIDSPEIQEADVIFVDINGVGTTLFPKEQGLGVATQIKKLFPNKYVVVYSAQPQQLHNSFTQVDAILPKNAEPYEYLGILESYLDQKQ